VIWALAIVLLLPIGTIVAGELEERLRYLDSPLRPALSVLRWWTVPLLGGWAIVRGLFEAPASDVLVRLLVSGLLVSLVAAALIVLRATLGRARRGPDGESRASPQLLLALPQLALLIVAGWYLLDRVWGVDLSAALAALGFGSLVVSFALQDTLGGLASGVLLVGDAPFRPGDWISFDETEGRVVDVNWRSSRIESRDGDLLVVPNAVLAGVTVVNHSRPTRVHRVVVPVQVAYVNPPTLARNMLLDAARSTPGVRDDPPPSVRVVQIDDPLMGYEVDLWIDDHRDAPRVFNEFGGLVWYASHRHDVPLPSPAYDLYLNDAVQAAEAARPSRSDVRERLLASPLLAQLDDDDVDQLLDGATPARFARGETILGGAHVGRGDLHVLWTGRARILADGATGEALDAGELLPGEVFGFFERGSSSVVPRVEAVDDCEVVRVEAGAAGEVISRNPALSSALEQIGSLRRRRLERLMTGPSTAGDDGLAAVDDRMV
jgi:small-conductance mechanosensitive channel/CRP-like cAMP-binding protein